MIMQAIRNVFFIKFIFLILLVSTSGCNQVFYKDVSDNPNVYFQEKYRLENLPRQVKHKIKIFHRGEIKKPDIIELTQDITKTDMNSMSAIKIHSIKKIEKLELGVIRSLEEQTKDGMPYSRVMEISYNGVMELKKETFINNKKIHSHFNEVRTIDKISFDISTMDINKNYKIIYQAGRKIDEYNYEKYEIECARKNKINGYNLHADIMGEAIEIMCKYYFKGEIYSSRKYWYLSSYDVSIIGEISDSSSVINYKIRKFTPVL